METINIYWLGYPLLGMLAGLLAGLLGVGGGLISVPILLWIFEHQHFPAPLIYKMALASAMAGIVFTSISSVRSHHRQGNVDWQIVALLAPGLLLGAWFGAFISPWVNDRYLVMIFIAFALYTSANMYFNWKVSANRSMPHPAITLSFAGGTGIISAFVSAGGGFLVVPYLTWCNVAMKRAVGCSAACGFPIALFGTLGYIMSGYGHEGLSRYALGWVYLPATIGIASTSMLTAGFGARLSSRLPVPVIRKIFSFLLLFIAISVGRRYF